MKRLSPIFFTILFTFTPYSAFAASGWFSANGAAIAWPGTSLSYHPEGGVCGPYSNAEILAELETYIGLWDASAFIGFTLNLVPGTLPEINADNYSDYSEGDAGGDDTHPVIFDDDGEIIESTSGEGSSESVLGFAGPSAYNPETGVISDGEMVMNCRCLAGNSLGTCGGGYAFDELTLFSTFTHEFGHLLGLDHSQVNIAAYNTETAEDNSTIPLMFPTDFEMSEVTMTTDDVASLAAVYPSASYAQSKCLVTGEILDASGNPLRCADVQAVPGNVADTISFVSGAAAVAADGNGDGDSVDEGECASGCGEFALYLTPGTDYVIRTEPIDPTFVGGSSVGPCQNEQLTDVRSEEIATVSGAACVGGGTVALGTLETSSTGGQAATGGAGDDDSSDDSGDSSGDATGGEDATTSSSISGCSLRAENSPSQSQTMAWIGILIFSAANLACRFLRGRPAKLKK